MSAYETLTDSIVDRILWSEDANLDRAKRILENIKSRNLYKCVGHTIPPNKMVRMYRKNYKALRR